MPDLLPYIFVRHCFSMFQINCIVVKNKSILYKFSSIVFLKKSKVVDLVEGKQNVTFLLDTNTRIRAGAQTLPQHGGTHSLSAMTGLSTKFPKNYFFLSCTFENENILSVYLSA